jgi:1-acyl-sn-glycerol-3-phosphate acyltransferase
MINFLKKLVLNLSFYTLLIPFSLVAVPVLTLFIAVQAPFVGHLGAMRLFRRAIRWYGFVVIYLLPRPLVRVRFENHSGGPIPDPSIVICNHRSSSDPFLMAVLPLDQAVQVVNTWPFRLPLWGPMAKWAGYLGVNDMPVEEFFGRASAMLKQGVSVIAFPEGTRTRTMEVGPFHGTLFRLALETRAPILPLCILGSERVPPRGTMVLNPGPVVLRSLPPVTWDQYKDLTAFQLKNKVRELIARELVVMEVRA